MRRLARALLFRALRLSLLPTLIRQTIQRRRVTIVLYHRIEPARAARHFRALRARYSVIPLARAAAALREGRVGELPEKPLVITFDDGHRENYGLLPLIRELELPVTIFLCSGIVGTNRGYWFLHEAASGRIGELLTLPNDEREARLARAGFEKERAEGARQSLSVEEMREMSRWVDFQAHTVFHPVLPTCSAEVAREEIARSKSDLETLLGTRVDAISYPSGLYSDRDVRLAREAGYACGITVDAGFNTATTDLLKLRRICIDDEDGVDGALVKATGLWAFLKNAFGRRVGGRVDALS